VDPGLDHDALSARIVRMAQCAADLRMRARAHEGNGRLLTEAIEEFHSSVETLTSVEEELIYKLEELARAEQTIDEQSRLGRAIFLAAPIAFVVTDRECRIVDANPAAERLLGCALGDLVGRPLGGFVAERDRPAWERLCRQLGERALVGLAAAVKLERGDGRTLPSILRTIATDGGTAIRWALEDASAIECAGEVERLAEEGRHKDEFLATLAHELRNPLGAIRSAIELWQHSGAILAEDQRRAGEVIARQADHLAKLVDDLLDVSRIAYGKLRYRPVDVDLVQVVDDVVTAMKPAIAVHGHALAWARPAAPTRIRGDPTRLRQVASNLLENAIKYTPDGGHIEVAVRTEPHKGRVHLVVHDDGIGITADKLARVFEPFDQGEAEPSQGGGGLGLGLAVVKQLVEMHGGSVQASSPGARQGSTFDVALPA
jgi:PAS domain S-box-containing protein